MKPMSFAHVKIMLIYFTQQMFRWQTIIMPVLLVFNLQMLMNVQPIPVGVVKPVVTLMDHFVVTVMKDMNCLMIKEHVRT